MAEAKSRILIVDDERDFRDIFSTKLKQAGFEVFQASDGTQGLADAKKIKPDLILLDVKMPNMNGIEMLIQMRKDPDLSRIKVVFLTNYGEPGKEAAWLDKKFAQEIGAVDYIRKSDDLDLVAATIKRVLARQSP